MQYSNLNNVFLYKTFAFKLSAVVTTIVFNIKIKYISFLYFMIKIK